MVTKVEVVRRLKRKQGKRPARELARELGCSEAYLSDVYRDRRAPGPRILSALGLRRVVAYEEVR